jgi:threonine dehydrogenase-like Zn-dependent dehydrogenase
LSTTTQPTISLNNGVPVRAYVPDLLERVWDGRIDPGKVFDLTLPLSDVAEAYAAMDERRAVKTMLMP